MRKIYPYVKLKAIGNLKNFVKDDSERKFIIFFLLISIKINIEKIFPRFLTK